MSRPGPLQPIAHRARSKILGRFLDRGRDRLAVVTPADLQNSFLHLERMVEMSFDQTEVADVEAGGELVCNPRLATRRKPDELALVAQQPETAGDGGVAISAGEPAFALRRHKPAI